MNIHSYIDPAVAEACEAECICPDVVLPLIGRVATEDAAASVSALFALLADPTRVRVLHALSMSEELCVCDIAFLTGASQSAISHQLRILRSAGAVRRRREGRTVFYSLDDKHLSHALLDSIRHVTEEDGPHAPA